MQIQFLKNKIYKKHIYHKILIYCKIKKFIIFKFWILKKVKKNNALRIIFLKMRILEKSDPTFWIFINNKYCKLFLKNKIYCKYFFFCKKENGVFQKGKSITFGIFF